MTEGMLAPVHPGEVLLEEFLKPLGLSQNRLALNIAVSPRRINEIVLGKRRITAETALRSLLRHHAAVLARAPGGLRSGRRLRRARRALEPGSAPSGRGVVARI
jgi:addiction module HigA family antidote